MSSSHCTILAPIFTHRQVLQNHQQMPEIGGKSVLVHVSDNHTLNYQRRDLRESPMRRRRREIFGMLNIWICLRFLILLCEWVLTEKYIGDDLQPMREQDTGQLGVRGHSISKHGFGSEKGSFSVYFNAISRPIRTYFTRWLIRTTSLV